jgi:uncharacterized protein YPO0396
MAKTIAKTRDVTKTFYMKVVLKYHINPFFKFVIIKTQLTKRYYHIVLHETLNLYFYLHLQVIQTPPKHVHVLPQFLMTSILVLEHSASFFSRKLNYNLNTVQVFL